MMKVFTKTKQRRLLKTYFQRLKQYSCIYIKKNNKFIVIYYLFTKTLDLVLVTQNNFCHLKTVYYLLFNLQQRISLILFVVLSPLLKIIINTRLIIIIIIIISFILLSLLRYLHTKLNLIKNQIFFNVHINFKFKLNKQA